MLRGAEGANKTMNVDIKKLDFKKEEADLDFGGGDDEEDIHSLRVPTVFTNRAYRVEIEG